MNRNWRAQNNQGSLPTSVGLATTQCRVDALCISENISVRVVLKRNDLAVEEKNRLRRHNGSEEEEEKGNEMSYVSPKRYRPKGLRWALRH